MKITPTTVVLVAISLAAGIALRRGHTVTTEPAPGGAPQALLHAQPTPTPHASLSVEKPIPTPAGNQQPRLQTMPRSNLFGPPPDDPIVRNHTFIPPGTTLGVDDPLGGLIYTGSARIGQQAYASIKDTALGEENTYRIGDSVRGYIVKGIESGVVTLQQRSVIRGLRLTEHDDPVPMRASEDQQALPNPGDLKAYRGQVNRTLFFKVAGSTTGSVWGTRGAYTDDSDLATAAVHAGVLRAGEVGVVRVTILPGADRFEGEISNGITSQPFAAWPGSFRVQR